MTNKSLKLKKSLKTTLVAASLASLALGSQAASLGRMNVLSGLGQPLRAEIEVSAFPEELETLTARVASPDAFRAANMDYPLLMSDLNFAIEKRGAKVILRMSSRTPVSDPFVGVLVELSWASGRQVRDYSLLLESPGSELRAQQMPDAGVEQVNAQEPLPAPPPSDLSAHKETAKTAARTYKVKPGDTLSKVAGEFRPDNVSLEQMLVALYRSNPKAFAGGNMNRLQAGKILQIPAPADVAQATTAQARQEVLAQARDFAGYREKLAARVHPASPDETPDRMDSGKIAPKVEDAQSAKAPRDQVKISRTEDKGALGKAEARAHALEEDLVARDKALKEATSRADELEKNVKELQKLGELKNQNLAELQKQADSSKAAPPAPPVAEAKPEPVKEAPAHEEPKEEAKDAAPAEAEKTPEAAEAPKEGEAASPAVVPEDEEEPPAPTFMDKLLSPLGLGAIGGSLALLGGIGGFLMYKRRKKADPETPAVDDPLPAASAIPEPDLELREPEADPAPLAVSEPVYEPEPEPVFVPEPEPVYTPPEPEPEPELELEEPAYDLAAPDEDLSLDFEPEPEPVIEPEPEPEPEPIVDEPLDLDFGLDLPVEPEPEEPLDLSDGMESLDITDLGDEDMLASGEFPEPEMLPDQDLMPPEDPPVDLSDLDLDYEHDEIPAVEDQTDEMEFNEEPLMPPEPEPEPEPEPMLEPEDEPEEEPDPEAETKLELARAYEDMGDREGARELLEEVVNEGTSRQRKEAREMLDRLG